MPGSPCCRPAGAVLERGASARIGLDRDRGGAGPRAAAAAPVLGGHRPRLQADASRPRGAERPRLRHLRIHLWRPRPDRCHRRPPPKAPLRGGDGRHASPRRAPDPLLRGRAGAGTDQRPRAADGRRRAAADPGLCRQPARHEGDARLREAPQGAGGRRGPDEGLRSRHLHFTETAGAEHGARPAPGVPHRHRRLGHVRGGADPAPAEELALARRGDGAVHGLPGVGTLGRILQDGARSVRIQGEEFTVRARIRTLDLYSGHADGTELVDWIKARLPIRHEVFLVHGEEAAMAALADRLTGIVDPAKVLRPELDEGFALTPTGSRRLAPDRAAAARAGTGRPPRLAQRGLAPASRDQRGAPGLSRREVPPRADPPPAAGTARKG
jgi:hypothetical protein